MFDLLYSTFAIMISRARQLLVTHILKHFSHCSVVMTFYCASYGYLLPLRPDIFILGDWIHWLPLISTPLVDWRPWRCPLQSICFSFSCRFSKKIIGQNNRLTPSPSGKSWIRHKMDAVASTVPTTVTIINGFQWYCTDVSKQRTSKLFASLWILTWYRYTSRSV